MYISIYQLMLYSCSSWAYHSDDGNFLGDGFDTSYGTPWNKGDVIGCGINPRGELYFTHNGELLGLYNRSL